jgi:signal transduction histidine kinase
VKVYGDSSALARALGNLIENAVKYCGPGGHVHVLLKATAMRLSYASTTTGQVFLQRKLGRVFDRFYRVDESRTEENGRPAGSGLGLAIVKTIIESHGGRVSASSDFGHGSEFFITLPLAEGMTHNRSVF